MQRRKSWTVNRCSHYVSLGLPDPDGKTDFDMRLPGAVEHVLEEMLAFESHAIDRMALPFDVSSLCSARRAR